MDKILVTPVKKEIRLKIPWWKSYMGFILFAGLIYGLMLLAILIAVVGNSFATDALANGEHYIMAKTEGYSMYPTLEPGQYAVIMLKSHLQFQLNEGDVVVYISGGYWIAHRLYKVENIDGQVYYMFKGDNNTYIDKPVPYDMIIGKVVYVTDNYFDAWSYEAIIKLGRDIDYLQNLFT